MYHRSPMLKYCKLKRTLRVATVMTAPCTSCRIIDPWPVHTIWDSLSRNMIFFFLLRHKEKSNENDKTYISYITLEGHFFVSKYSCRTVIYVVSWWSLCGRPYLTNLYLYCLMLHFIRLGNASEQVSVRALIKRTYATRRLLEFWVRKAVGDSHVLTFVV